MKPTFKKHCSFYSELDVINTSLLKNAIVCKNIEQFFTNVRWIWRLKPPFYNDLRKFDVIFFYNFIEYYAYMKIKKIVTVCSYLILINSIGEKKSYSKFWRVAVKGKFNLQILHRFSHEKNCSMFLLTMTVYGIFEKKSVFILPSAI